MIKRYDISLYKNNILDKEYKNIKGINNKEHITLVLDDIKTIIKKEELIRENNEFKFYLNLNKKNSNYLLKEHNKLYDIEVFKSNIERKNNKITINYLIETNDDEITIKIEESK